MEQVGSTKLTQKFLNQIAYHLSGRPECKGATYTLAIGMLDDSLTYQIELNQEENIKCRVIFSPDISVFPNRHDRKPGSQIPVLSHILKTHFPETLRGCDSFGNLLIREGKFVPGIYVYKPYSTQHSRRKWFKVK